MNLQEAADYLGRDPTEVRKLAKAGLIPAWQNPMRREWEFDEDELMAWAEANPKQSHKLAAMSDEYLVALCEGRSYADVAAMLGVTASDISYRMRYLGHTRYTKGDE